MKFLPMLFAAVLLSSLSFSAAFSITPYLYASEENASVTYTNFTAANNSSVSIVKVAGDEALLVLDGKIATDKSQISAMLTEYYTKNYYPTDAELSELLGYADAFNASRNYMTKYGPAEKTCYESGTFLAHKPCSDMASCTQTASLVCTITGADGCLVDVLAINILEYKKGIDSLNAAYASFSSAYLSFSPATAATSLNQMEAAFNSMKTAADNVSKSKLRFPETTTCGECLGICPEAHFDYASITSAKGKITTLRTKVAPFVLLETVVDKIALSTETRVGYRAGEEQAAIYAPQYGAAKAKYGGLKSRAVETLLLVSDASYVGAANSFLGKSDELEQKLTKRNFTGFDSLLSSYQSSGMALSAMLANATMPYNRALDAQDTTGDAILQAQWRVNLLSKSSVDSYNALVNNKTRLDETFSPPMTSAQYLSLAAKYDNLTASAQAYVKGAASYQDSVFSASNKFARTAVDGTMSIISGITPVSFKTRQAVAKFVPPIVVGAVDLSILAVAMLVLLALFYHFRGLFKSRLAISGWLIFMLGFVLVLLIGSVGFYMIVLSTEKSASFADFSSALRPSATVAVIVDEEGASGGAVAAMRSCAGQIASQLNASGKKTLIYYLGANGKCTSILPKAAAPPAINATNATNATNTTIAANATGAPSGYIITANQTNDACLNAIPDVPVFDLEYSQEDKMPTFTTVVAKQAIVSGNEAYYAREPMCDAANVLN